MKKIIIAAGALLTLAASCKKYDDVSQVVNVSYPTITITGDRFYSIRPGDPVPSVAATAYDSILRESVSTVFDPNGVDASTPGLYVVPITAKNRNGYVSSDVVYIAVTNIPDDYDLSGTYLRAATGANVSITKIARGLYETDDVGGAPSLPITAYFVQLTDNTLQLPPQPTDVGTLSAVNAQVNKVDSDTVITWAVRNASFGTALRTFVKQ